MITETQMKIEDFLLALVAKVRLHLVLFIQYVQVIALLTSVGDVCIFYFFYVGCPEDEVVLCACIGKMIHLIDMFHITQTVVRSKNEVQFPHAEFPCFSQKAFRSVTWHENEAGFLLSGACHYTKLSHPYSRSLFAC